MDSLLKQILEMSMFTIKCSSTCEGERVNSQIHGTGWWLSDVGGGRQEGEGGQETQT